MPSSRRPRRRRRSIAVAVLGVAALAIAAVSPAAPPCSGRKLTPSDSPFALRPKSASAAGTKLRLFTGRLADRLPLQIRRRRPDGIWLRPLSGAGGATDTGNGERRLSLLVARWPLARLSSPAASCGAWISRVAPRSRSATSNASCMYAGTWGAGGQILFARLRGRCDLSRLDFRRKAGRDREARPRPAARRPSRGPGFFRTARASSTFCAGGHRRQPDVFTAQRACPAAFPDALPGRVRRPRISRLRSRGHAHRPAFRPSKRDGFRRAVFDRRFGRLFLERRVGGLRDLSQRRARVQTLDPPPGVAWSGSIGRAGSSRPSTRGALGLEAARSPSIPTVVGSSSTAASRRPGPTTSGSWTWSGRSRLA